MSNIVKFATSFGVPFAKRYPIVFRVNGEYIEIAEDGSMSGKLKVSDEAFGKVLFSHLTFTQINYDGRVIKTLTRYLVAASIDAFTIQKIIRNCLYPSPDDYQGPAYLLCEAIRHGLIESHFQVAELVCEIETWAGNPSRPYGAVLDYLRQLGCPFGTVLPQGYYRGTTWHTDTEQRTINPFEYKSSWDGHL